MTTHPLPPIAPDSDGPLVTLPEVDLATVIGMAALQERHDRKYLLPQERLDELGTALVDSGAAAAVLAVGERRWFGYRSDYFDTPTLASYRAAAHRRPRRHKVRTRSYLDSDDHFLEVKVRDRTGRTVKTRTSWSPTADWSLPLAAEGARFVDTVLGGSGAALPHLRGQLRTDYLRMTLLLPDEAARVTLDVGLTATDPTGRRLDYGRLAVVETKTTGRPCAVDRLLWRLGHRPMRVSKYATSLAALRPGLPANRWRPALRLIAT